MARAPLHLVPMSFRYACGFVAEHHRHHRPPAGMLQHEMADERDHRELAEALHVCTAAVVLSGYPSQLYDELYREWHASTLPAFTGQAGTRGRRTEVLWTNRPQQLGLFTAGGDAA